MYEYPIREGDKNFIPPKYGDVDGDENKNETEDKYLF